MIKKYVFYALAAVCCIGLLNSCSKIASQLAQSASFTWTGVDVTIDVPPTSDTSNETSMGTGSFSYNLDSVIKSKTNNLLGLSNIDTFRFNSCTLTITNSDASNSFGNFKMAKATFSSSANTTPVILGEVDNNPATVTNTLTLPINTTANMKTYIPNSGAVTLNYACSGKLRMATTTTLHVIVHVEYYIHVKP